MKPIDRLILAVLLPLLVLILPAFATAESLITVCMSGPPACDYVSIQAAINAANFGDTVIVSAGTYTEQLTLKSGLTLTSTDGPTSTIVTALASPIVFADAITATQISGFTIEGTHIVTQPIGIDATGSELTLSSMVIRDLHGADGNTNVADGSSAIGLRTTGIFSLTIVDSTIENVTGGNGKTGVRSSGGNGAAVFADGAGRLTISGSFIRSVSGGAGHDSYGGMYSSCNGLGGHATGVETHGTVNVLIEQTSLTNIAGGAPCTGTGFCAINPGPAIAIRATGGSIIVRNNTISGLVFSPGASPSYGVYVQGGSQAVLNNNVIGNSSVIRSRNANAVLRPTSPGPYCSDMSSSIAGVGVEGFDVATISANTISHLGGTGSGGQGTGVVVNQTNHAQVLQNAITDLWGNAASPVSGITAFGVTQLTVDANRIVNLQGGSALPIDSYPYFMVPNGGSATGISVSGAPNAVVVNNIVQSLVGGHGAPTPYHISNGGTGNPTYISNGGYSNGGDAVAIGLNGGGTTQVHNNVLYRTSGGGATVPWGVPGTDSGLYVDASSSAFASNNVLAQHTTAITLVTASNVQLDYNALWNNQTNYAGTEAGVHDLHVDPKFIDPGHGDFHLAPNSPLIDAGSSGGAPDHDLDGKLRPLDGNDDGQAIFDIGAYEYGRGPLDSSMTVNHLFATPGQTLTYLIYLRNPNFQISFPHINVTDSLPIETQDVVAYSWESGQWGQADNVVTWTVAVDPRDGAGLYIDAVISPTLVGPHAIINQATVDDGVGAPLFLRAVTFVNPVQVYLPLVRR